MANRKLRSYGFSAGTALATVLMLLLGAPANSQAAAADARADLSALHAEAAATDARAVLSAMHAEAAAADARDSESSAWPSEPERLGAVPREGVAETSSALAMETSGDTTGAMPAVLITPLSEAPATETSSARAMETNGDTTGAVPAVLITPLSEAPATEAAKADAASSKGKVIYMTFDDGPSRTYTPEVLAVLARYHAHATFFIVGQNGKVDPDLLKAIKAGGNLLGNHTYDHPFLADLSRAEVRSELRLTEKVLGSRGGPCMRPPFGSVNRVTRSEAARLGLKLVMWDIDPRDWSRPGVSHIASFILNEAYPGAIVLMHDGGSRRSQTVAALEIVLRGLSRRGYHFATLPACR